MSEHSVVEAKNQLSALIDKAMRGERIVITRHGRPVVTLDPVGTAAKVGDVDDNRPSHSASRVVPAGGGGAQPKIMSHLDFDWLERVSIKTSTRADDAADLIRKMRDEGE
jgi:prevent-host-death family protein